MKKMYVKILFGKKMIYKLSTGIRHGTMYCNWLKKKKSRGNLLKQSRWLSVCD